MRFGILIFSFLISLSAFAAEYDTADSSNMPTYSCTYEYWKDSTRFTTIVSVNARSADSAVTAVQATLIVANDIKPVFVHCVRMKD